MEISTLEQYNLPASNLGLVENQITKKGNVNPEMLFESIFMKLLSQSVGLEGSKDNGMLGLNGPWKNLIYTVLNESLMNGQKTGVGQLISNSIYNNKNGG